MVTKKNFFFAFLYHKKELMNRNSKMETNLPHVAQIHTQKKKPNSKQQY